MRHLPPLLLLGACAFDPDAGTAVGNPTGLTVDTAPGAAVSIVSATADVDRMVTTTCAGETRTVEVDGSLDLLGGRAVEVLLADACALRVDFAGPLAFSGMGPDDSSFTLALSLASLDLTVTAPSEDLPHAILRLGAVGWVSDTSLGLTPGASVDVGPGDPLHDALVDTLVTDAAIYRDPDGDGRCGDACDDEPVGEHERDDEESDDDSGEEEDEEESGGDD